MKPLIRSVINATKVIIVIALLSPSICEAQRYFRYKKKQPVFVGIETSIVTGSFKIASDLKEYNNLKLNQEGYGVGIFAGGKKFQFKVRTAFTKAPVFGEQVIKITNLQTSFNIFPLSFKKKSKEFIKPYLTLGIGQSEYPVSAYVTPKPAEEKPPAEQQCQCTCMPPPPPPVEEPDPVPQLQTGSFRIVQLSVGSGVQVHMEKKNFFINLHAEFQYGLPIGYGATVPGFENTTVSKQFITNGGIAVGRKYIKRRF